MASASFVLPQLQRPVKRWWILQLKLVSPSTIQTSAPSTPRPLRHVVVPGCHGDRNSKLVLSCPNAQTPVACGGVPRTWLGDVRSTPRLPAGSSFHARCGQPPGQLKALLELCGDRHAPCTPRRCSQSKCVTNWFGNATARWANGLLPS